MISKGLTPTPAPARFLDCSDDLSSLIQVLDRRLLAIDRKLELLYQLHYFLGQQLAADNTHYHQFVKQLKDYVHQKIPPGSDL